MLFIVGQHFIITCYWIILSNFNMSFHHVYRQPTWILCNFSWRTSCQIIMIIGLHLIAIDFSASWNELWVKNLFYYCHGKRVMVVPCMYVLNRFSKCQCFALLLLLQLVTMVSRTHSELRRLCQNKRFPAAKGFTWI